MLIARRARAAMRGLLQPWLRRIFRASFAGNRILAIRPVLSCRHDRFGLSPKIWLVAWIAAWHAACGG